MAMRQFSRSASVFVLFLGLTTAVVAAQSKPQSASQPATSNGKATTQPVEAEFVIGVNDVLQISVWRDPELSVDAIPVLPDGRITLKLVNSVQAAGLTPTQLAENLTKAYSEWVNKPVITVIVKQVNSRQVCTQGKIAKIGCFNMTPNMDVLRLISDAGGLLEFADEKNLTLVRYSELRPDGKPWTYNINYNELKNRRKMEQNLTLKPGDMLIVK